MLWSDGSGVRAPASGLRVSGREATAESLNVGGERLYGVDLDP